MIYNVGKHSWFTTVSHLLHCTKLSDFTNMSYKALFLYIISMCDENIINLSASYIENILHCCKSKL